MKQIFVINLLLISICFTSAVNEQLLHFVADEVSGGSYKYYSLMYDGTIKIILTSSKGDADLYVSQLITKPTYEPDQHCLQSTTCGGDTIFIPHTFKRPVSIGIYGHPSHKCSQYNLFVYRIARGNGEILEEQSSTNKFDNNSPKRIKTTKKSFILSFLFTIIEEVLEALFSIAA